MIKPLIIFCLLGFLIETSGAIFYVATDGNDLSEGTLNNPLATLNEAVNRMDAGDTCIFRGGRYRQSLVLSNKDNLTFRAYENEQVIFDGTTPLITSWTQYSGNIYQTPVSADFWQLFAGEQMMMPARWPNAALSDESVWDQPGHWAKVIYSSSKTDFVDDPTAHSNLEQLNFSVQGSIAVLAVGSFKSYAREILNHTAGSPNFTVSAVGNRKASNYQYYFLEGLLEFVDSPGEWYLDRENDILYAWGDTNAAFFGKTQDYAFNFSNCDDITISDIDFFGTTVRFNNCQRSVVENGTFSFPSCTKRMLGESGDQPEMTEFTGGGNHHFYNNVVRYADTPAIYMNSGLNNKIENCLFEYIDWSAADLPSLMMTVYMRGSGSIFSGNSAHTTGASAFLDVNSAVQAFSNEVWHTGLVQNDGSIIQLTLAAQPNSETAYNWFFDTEKYGARFDASTAIGSPTGSNGLMHHNVGFNVNAAIMQKGDDHQCINNTAFNNSNNGIIILSDNVSTNSGTVVRNNVAERIGSHRKNNVPLTEVMDHSHNWNGYEYGSADISTVLRDPDNLDFRPKPNSILIDNGKSEGLITVGYIGMAPDMGAYEFGANDYWMPGRKEAGASKPIPPEGAQNVKSSAALMWRKALGSQMSHLYLGSESNLVSQADINASEYKGAYVNNLYDPHGLDVGTYYWRVDEVTSAGIVKGDIWRFEVNIASSLAPELTVSISDVDTQSVILSAIPNSDISYGLSLEYWKESAATNVIEIGSWAGTYAYELTNLDSNETYYFQYSGSNAFGIATSSITNFITSDEVDPPTPPAPPTADILFYDFFDDNWINQSPNPEKWNNQITLNQGVISVLQSNSRVFTRLYNPNSGSSGDRTVMSAVDAITPHSLITVSFDSLFEGSVTPAGSFFIGAGIGSLASHQNQIRKVSMRDHAGLDQWDHFDWIVNQTGSNVTYQVGSQSYVLNIGCFDLWKNGNLLIQNSDEKTTSPQDTVIDDLTPITSIGFTVNKNDTVSWQIDNFEIRDNVYVKSTLTGYDSWANLHGVQAATNDWDGDGLINLVEYGVGSEPRDATDGPQRLPYLDVVNSQVDYIYHRRKSSDSNDINYIFETSAELSSNSWNTWEPTMVGSTLLEGSIERVTNDVGELSTQQYFRMRMELNE